MTPMQFGPTMRMAHKALTTGRGRDAAQKHVIILSDGDAQSPSLSLLRDFADSKITVSTIAIGCQHSAGHTDFVSFWAPRSTLRSVKS